jgi:transposase InsO family protein
VARVLERLLATRARPAVIVCDNGPEFAGKTLDAWAYAAGVKIHFIRPGKPVENCYVESFNGKFRDECLETEPVRRTSRRIQLRPPGDGHLFSAHEPELPACSNVGTTV